MEQTDRKKKVKTIIIPQGAFDANDTIVLKVPKSTSQPTTSANQNASAASYDRRIRSNRRTSSPSQQMHDQQYVQYEKTTAPTSPRVVMQPAEQPNFNRAYAEGQRASEAAFAYRDYNQEHMQRTNPNGPQRINNYRGKTSETGGCSLRGISDDVPSQSHYNYKSTEEAVQQRKLEQAPLQPYQDIHTEGEFDAELAEKYKQTLLRQNYQFQGYPDGHGNDEYEEKFPNYYQDYQQDFQEGWPNSQQ